MKYLMISYDLLKPGKDYANLFARLNAIGAKRIMLSQWELNTTQSADDVCTDLMNHIDGNDRLLVTALTGEASWTGLLITDQQFKDRLTA